MIDFKEFFGVVFVIVVIVVGIGSIGFYFGMKFGTYQGINIGKTKSCELNTTWIPPLYCNEITHNIDGYRCCNFENKTLICGRPLLKVGDQFYTN